MKMRYFETRKARVEIIPMIDVMLFLLVFFIIVTLQMIPDTGASLQLATSTRTDKLEPPKVLVNVLANGTMQVKHDVVNAAQLTALLKADGDPAKTELTIAADRSTAFQHFFAVMDAARAAGVSDVGVAARQASSAQ
ncbi:ExbD/TolR family protein [Lichenicoccus sp.]|uniref:ExbD/TolR family protein n=1 Tax=Lichenicoccus sp. TaxID=2781899 RepID=UPI003D0DE059